MQNQAEEVVLPINQAALAQQVQIGSSLDLAKYLTPDAEDESVRLSVVQIDAASGDIRCKARCAPRNCHA